MVLSYSLCLLLFQCSSLLNDGPDNAASYRLTSPLIGSCIVKSNDTEVQGIIEVLFTHFNRDEFTWDFVYLAVSVRGLILS